MIAEPSPCFWQSGRVAMILQYHASRSVWKSVIRLNISIQPQNETYSRTQYSGLECANLRGKLRYYENFPGYIYITMNHLRHWWSILDIQEQSWKRIHWIPKRAAPLWQARQDGWWKGNDRSHSRSIKDFAWTEPDPDWHNICQIWAVRRYVYCTAMETCADHRSPHCLWETQVSPCKYLRSDVWYLRLLESA